MDAKTNAMTQSWWNSSLAYAARSDVGMRRSNNQDSFSTHPAGSARIWRSRGHVFVCADGMGAHKAGELASKIAATEAPASYLRRTAQTPGDALRDAMLEAHATIRKRGDSDPSFHDMGTTCDMLVLMPGSAYIGHVGDSRVYRLRNHAIEQMTFDHSLVWEIKYFPTSHSAYRQIENIPKNIITRSLGPTDNLAVDIEGPFDTQPGDVFLMCSDGLSGRVDDSEIGQILELFQPSEAAEALVNLANLRGGPDNCTVVIARVLSNELPEDAESAVPDRVYEKRPPLSLFAWCFFALTAIFAICGGVFLAMGNTAIGWSSLGASAVALLAAGCAALPSFVGARPEIPTERQGKGPYVRESAVPNAAFNEKLEDTCKRLCAQLRGDTSVEPDWAGVDRACELAADARSRGDFATSIRAVFSVVNYMMREVYKHRELVRKTRSHAATVAVDSQK